MNTIPAHIHGQREANCCYYTRSTPRLRVIPAARIPPNMEFQMLSLPPPRQGYHSIDLACPF
jgi:hypothetical protein